MCFFDPTLNRFASVLRNLELNRSTRFLLDNKCPRLHPTSLGNIAGSGFSPIVNAPEVGILGVSRAAIKPVWDGKAFVPRNMLPLALSYDHRVINGGDGGRFMTRLVSLLGDIRQLVM